MEIVRKLISGVLAGGCISLGATAYLSVDSAIVGAVLFGIGLFVICTAGLDLYTGQISFIAQTKDPLIFVVIAGNIIGAICSSSIVKLANLQNVIAKAQVITQNKLDKGLLSLLILAALCNICIYIAVAGYRNINDVIGKYISLFLGVITFIVCGFEHSIADFFYFSLAGWNVQSLYAIIVIIIGNAIGGICAHNLHIFATKAEKK